VFIGLIEQAIISPASFIFQAKYSPDFAYAGQVRSMSERAKRSLAGLSLARSSIEPWTEVPAGELKARHRPEGTQATEYRARQSTSLAKDQ